MAFLTKNWMIQVLVGISLITSFVNCLVIPGEHRQQLNKRQPVSFKTIAKVIQNVTPPKTNRAGALAALEGNRLTTIPEQAAIDIHKPALRNPRPEGIHAGVPIPDGPQPEQPPVKPTINTQTLPAEPASKSPSTPISKSPQNSPQKQSPGGSRPVTHIDSTAQSPASQSPSTPISNSPQRVNSAKSDPPSPKKSPKAASPNVRKVAAKFLANKARERKNKVHSPK